MESRRTGRHRSENLQTERCRNRPQGLHLPDGAEGHPQPETVLRSQQHHTLQSRRRPNRPSGSGENQRRHRSHRNRRHESHGL
ncbi:hypothetical protein [Bacteroides intestinalis]|uniref:hypothetical protein n=1 Tax=Bacteroides intestinalis TaxID=329854 RepID=UPI00216AC42B|nr:hypothetical protein [Bacteroides intestinalis]